MKQFETSIQAKEAGLLTKTEVKSLCNSMLNHTHIKFMGDVLKSVVFNAQTGHSTDNLARLNIQIVDPNLEFDTRSVCETVDSELVYVGDVVNNLNRKGAYCLLFKKSLVIQAIERANILADKYIIKNGTGH